MRTTSAELQFSMQRLDFQVDFFPKTRLQSNYMKITSLQNQSGNNIKPQQKPRPEVWK